MQRQQHQTLRNIKNQGKMTQHNHCLIIDPQNGVLQFAQYRIQNSALYENSNKNKKRQFNKVGKQ